MKDMIVPSPCKALLTLIAIAATASSQAALLTSFSDDFNRADGAIGSNYTVGRGPDWAIVNNVATLAGANDSYTYLNIGTLPTTLDYSAGYSFTASFDFLISGDVNNNTPSIELLVNYQDVSNFSGIGYRGDDNMVIRGVERFSNTLRNVSLTSTLPVTFGDWYTIGISSTSVGNYAWTFTDRNTSTLVASGTWIPADNGSHTFSGGFLAFGADGGSGGYVYQMDNLSVTVVPEPGVVTLLATGLIGLVGVRRLIKRRS